MSTGLNTGYFYSSHPVQCTCTDCNPSKEEKNPKKDNINPEHYRDGGIETIDFIEAKKLGYHLGCAVKYISRAGKKHDNIKEDLQKAVWYLNRYIEVL